MKEILPLFVVGILVLSGLGVVALPREYATMDNQPPGKPWINGPTFERPGTYEYTFKAIDPDGDNVSYCIRWDDGTDEEWTGLYPSGEEVTRSHTYKEMGAYVIRAKAKDIHDAEGPWGELMVRFTRSTQQSSSTPSSQNTMSVIPSTEDIVEDASVYNRMLDAVDSSEEILFCGNIVYGFILWGPMGTGFYAFGPGNRTWFREWEGDDFFSAATWTNDGRLFFCMHDNGTLYEVDPKTFDAWAIGDGGTSLNGLSSDPTTGKLYGASSNGTTGGLWLIDPEDGSQEYIGDFVNTAWVIGMAFDFEGTLYAWDISPDRLYTVDTSTGYATVVGSLGINLNYAQDGDFCKEEDILYLAAYVISPYYGSYLFECDEDTGECFLIGQFEGNSHPTAWAISYEFNMTPPVTTISFDPPYPDGDNGWYVNNVTVTLNAIDNTGVKDTYYRINGGEWKTYDSPFVISEDGDDILIEYYSIDYVGNIEDVKSSYLDIDKTPPETSLEWEVWKEGCKWYVRFILNATDETSGMDNWVEFYINDVLQGEFEVHWPTFELTIQWSKNFKFCTFKFVCLDMAGHSAFELVNGSDIKSYSYSQSSITQQSSNPLFFQIVQRLLNIR